MADDAGVLRLGRRAVGKRDRRQWMAGLRCGARSHLRSAGCGKMGGGAEFHWCRGTCPVRSGRESLKAIPFCVVLCGLQVTCRSRTHGIPTAADPDHVILPATGASPISTRSHDGPRDLTRDLTVSMV